MRKSLATVCPPKVGKAKCGVMKTRFEKVTELSLLRLVFRLKDKGKDNRYGNHVSGTEERNLDRPRPL